MVGYAIETRFIARSSTSAVSLCVYKNHVKMVKGCRTDTGSCKKPLSKKDSPKTLGTRVSCKLNRYRARWAKGKTDIGLDEHRATHI